MASSARSTSRTGTAPKRPAATKATPKKAAERPAATTAAKRAATKRSAPKAATRDPRGGLTAAGRAAFAKRDGARLRPGVQGPADTPEKMRRKGSFLRRHFANPRGPMVDDRGEPTRLALSAQAWGERLPKTAADARRLAAKGTKLLEQYHASQERAATKRGTKPAAKSAATRSIKRATTKRATTKRTTATRGGGTRAASHTGD